tara:strand:+ start:266 stop:472 length:207 start_codon:yes stop_codon:yes gene_type:complete
MGHLSKECMPLSIAVLTVSDTRTRETDSSGEYLCVSASEAGHKVVQREIVIDDVYLIRAAVSLCESRT